MSHQVDGFNAAVLGHFNQLLAKNRIGCILKQPLPGRHHLDEAVGGDGIHLQGTEHDPSL